MFTSTQFLLIGTFVLEPIAVLYSINSDSIIGFAVILLVPIMLLINYKQLFGYGCWGTIWRVLMIIPFGVLIFRLIVRSVYAVNNLIEQSGIMMEFWQNMIIVADVVIHMWLLTEIVGVINRKSWRELGWMAFKRPLMIALASILTGYACYRLGVEGAVVGLVKSYINIILS